MLDRSVEGGGPKQGGYFVGKLWESHDEWQTVSGPAPAKIYLPDGILGYGDSGHPFPGICLHRTTCLGRCRNPVLVRGEAGQ